MVVRQVAILVVSRLVVIMLVELIVQIHVLEAVKGLVLEPVVERAMVHVNVLIHISF